MRYDNDVSPMGGWQRRDEPVRYAPFRGQPVDHVHTQHPGERAGRPEHGDFATRGLTGRREVNPRVNLIPRQGETDFLGRPYEASAYQNVPRGLYDQEHRQAALERGYDRGMRGYDRAFRGYDRGMRGYDGGMRGMARYDREYWTMRGYDGDVRGMHGGHHGIGGTRPRGHGGGMGYGQDYEAVRDRFGAGPWNDGRWRGR